jgi:hypothetical protein
MSKSKVTYCKSFDHDWVDVWCEKKKMWYSVCTKCGATQGEC